MIVNFNTGDYLERCLGSLETHRGDVGIDVLVIDNASVDGSHTPRVAAHPWARLIENRENIYLSPAWNQGIRATAAPYVLLLNPDTEWWAGTLADYVSVARAHPRAGIVGPLIRNPDGTVYPSGRRSRASSTPSGHALLRPGASPTTGSRAATTWTGGTAPPSARSTGSRAPACCCPARRSRRSGCSTRPSRSSAEELDMATRLRDAGWSVLFTPDVEVLHALGVSRGRSRRMSVMHSTSVYRYYRKHRAAGWRKLTLPFAWTALRARAELAWLVGRFAG